MGNPDAAPSQAMVRSFVVGTAGHIDHGKSTLVKALTGTDPDRLAEEKARGMTIDLGFAWLQTPAGTSVSIVDVPGHERFIKNMLAGVGGIDAALLVIAADEGPMPQTREHLAILDLLGVKRGVVALTKRDLVDQDWSDLVAEEVAELLAPTGLAAAEIVPVSATTGDGLPVLLSALDRALAGVEARRARGKPRLPIDRVFSVAGFGTVVTGTLLGGALTIGQELVLLPGGKPTRVRGLQSHDRTVERAEPGRRVAVNVANLAVDVIRRGDVLAPSGIVTASHLLDVRLCLLPDSPVALEQNAGVDLFAGAAEVRARVTLLDRDRLEPGADGWVQLRMREPLALLAGDRFIVRRPSPSDTIGGGAVIDPAPARHRRFRPEVLAALETLAAGTPEELILQAAGYSPVEVNVLWDMSFSGSELEIGRHAVTRLLADGRLRNLSRIAAEPIQPADHVIVETVWSALLTQLHTALDDFHRAHPLRSGMPREELKRNLPFKTGPRLFDEVLGTAQRDGVLTDDSTLVRRSGFAIVLDPIQEAHAAAYEATLRASPFSPPGPPGQGLDAGTLGAMVDLGRLVKVGDGLYFHPAAYAQVEQAAIGLLEANGTLTLAQLRDHLDTSRRYAQALLEYLDGRRITRRVGDERVRYTGAGAGTPVGGPP